MSETKTPYRPGFSQMPTVLAGRDEIVMAAEEALALAADDHITPTPLLLVGPRGVGKTVLLGEIAARAGAIYGWPRLQLELTGEPFVPQLLAGAEGVTSLLEQTSRSERMRLADTTVRAALPGVSAELHFTRDAATGDPGPASSLLHVIARLAELAQQRDTGVLVTLDELQLAERTEITAFGAVVQRAVGEGWPLVVVGAGLSAMREEGRLPTYFERAEWHEVGILEPAAALHALTDPARAAGRPFEADAAAYLAAQTGGYPYAIQLYGHHAWRASRGTNRITLKHAEIAAQRGTVQLASGLYANRWGQTSPREREYLTAAAQEFAEQGAFSNRAIARRLGTTGQALSVFRANLITKGVLTGVGEQLEFAVPGMADYVLTMSPDHPPNPPASKPSRPVEKRPGR
jgi:hypothetical protein